MSALVIGLDPHKASNTIAVLDAEETLVARRRFENTADGLVAMLDAASSSAHPRPPEVDREEPICA